MEYLTATRDEDWIFSARYDRGCPIANQKSKIKNQKLLIAISPAHCLLSSLHARMQHRHRITVKRFLGIDVHHGVYAGPSCSGVHEPDAAGAYGNVRGNGRVADVDFVV